MGNSYLRHQSPQWRPWWGNTIWLPPLCLLWFYTCYFICSSNRSQILIISTLYIRTLSHSRSKTVLRVSLLVERWTRTGKQSLLVFNTFVVFHWPYYSVTEEISSILLGNTTTQQGKRATMLDINVSSGISNRLNFYADQTAPPYHGITVTYLMLRRLMRCSTYKVTGFSTHLVKVWYTGRLLISLDSKKGIKFKENVYTSYLVHLSGKSFWRYSGNKYWLCPRDVGTIIIVMLITTKMNIKANSKVDGMRL